jgi:hypothetical protein
MTKREIDGSNPKEIVLKSTFEYGSARVKDLVCRVRALKNGKTEVAEVDVDGKPCMPTSRFWVSLQARFGFSRNIFRYFSHQEVFDRISTVAPNDQVRYCLEKQAGGNDTILAVTNPHAPVIRYDHLQGLLNQYQAESISYSSGVIRSRHAPRVSDPFHIGSDAFANKYIIDTPIDGFGRPSVYLALLRMICSNGAIAYSRAFRSEINLGRAGDGVEYGLTSVLDGFNNEEGYTALQQRFESAMNSWASVNEVNKLYKVLLRLHHHHQVRNAPVPACGSDGAEEIQELQKSWPVLQSFKQLTGNLQEQYGLVNFDALSVKRQRTLPTKTKMYDLLNFTSEVATHHATDSGSRVLQAFLGELVSRDYDLEGSGEAFGDWRDFFVGNAATTETLAELNKAST